MKRILIAGYGGIGKTIASKLHQQGHEITIISRQTDISLYSSINLDLSDADSVQPLTEQLAKHTFDVVINTAAILSNQQHTPEKNLLQCQDDWLLHSVQANVLTSVHLAQALQAHAKKSTMQFIAFSARVGSISDNRMGGWYSYRMTKAMLNMFIKNLHIEWQRFHKETTVIGYHPGTVATELSKPFSSNVPKDKLFSQEQAADYFCAMLENLSPDMSGTVVDWQQKTVLP